MDSRSGPATSPPFVLSRLTLTEQELQIAQQTPYDLGSGYPQIDIPPYIRAAYLETSIAERALAIAPSWRPHDNQDLDSEVTSAVVGFLRVPAHAYHWIATTFTGGVALDRALTAAIHLDPEASIERHHVITTSPSIDIMRLLLAERGSRINPIFVESRAGGLGALDAEQIVECIRTTRKDYPHDGLVVLLASPENPTGEHWSKEQLRAIGISCEESQGVLIVDHAFLAAGIHRYDQITPVWNAMPVDTNWIAIWDTGKTFGLNQEKLGFLLCGSALTADALANSLRVLQFDVSRRQKLTFATILSAEASPGYLSQLRAACQQNYQHLNVVSENAPFEVRRQSAGSLAMIRLDHRLRRDMEHVRSTLLRHGVGVVSAAPFFHTRWLPTGYLRIALARDQHHFARGIAIMAESLSRI